MFSTCLEEVGFYFYYGNKIKSINEQYINKAIEIMKQDPEISYYVDWIKEWNDEQKGSRYRPLDSFSSPNIFRFS